VINGTSIEMPSGFPGNYVLICGLSATTSDSIEQGPTVSGYGTDITPLPLFPDSSGVLYSVPIFSSAIGSGASTFVSLFAFQTIAENLPTGGGSTTNDIDTTGITISGTVTNNQMWSFVLPLDNDIVGEGSMMAMIAKLLSKSAYSRKEFAQVFSKLVPTASAVPPGGQEPRLLNVAKPSLGVRPGVLAAAASSSSGAATSSSLSEGGGPGLSTRLLPTYGGVGSLERYTSLSPTTLNSMGYVKIDALADIPER